MLKQNLSSYWQIHYVQFMMHFIRQGLIASSQIDTELKKEISQFPTGFVICMNIFPTGPAFYLKKNSLSHFEEVEPTSPNLTITFKHIHHAFLVFSFQESTVQAFANDRMIATGDLSYAVRTVRCLNRMQSLILPKFIAKKIVKGYPSQLTTKEKIQIARKIYFHIAQLYFK